MIGSAQVTFFFCVALLIGLVPTTVDAGFWDYVERPGKIITDGKKKLDEANTAVTDGLTVLNTNFTEATTKLNNEATQVGAEVNTGITNATTTGHTAATEGLAKLNEEVVTKPAEKANTEFTILAKEAGQTLMHYLEQATKITLSCSLPDEKPMDIGQPYQAACSGVESTYHRDLDTCHQAGGISGMAFTGAPAAAAYFPIGTAFGTYGLAKIALQLCENACNSQRSLETCVADQDAQAAAKATEAAAAVTRNDNAIERQDLFSCVDDAYGGSAGKSVGFSHFKSNVLICNVLLGIAKPFTLAL